MKRRSYTDAQDAVRAVCNLHAVLVMACDTVNSRPIGRHVIWSRLIFNFCDADAVGYRNSTLGKSHGGKRSKDETMTATVTAPDGSGTDHSDSTGNYGTVVTLIRLDRCRMLAISANLYNNIFNVV